MNCNQAFVIGFFSVFGAVLVVNHVSRLYQTYWPPTSDWIIRKWSKMSDWVIRKWSKTSKWVVRNWSKMSKWVFREVLLSRLFRGQHVLNPTRIELLCHLAHWTAVIVYNTWGVDSLDKFALRTGQLAVVHVVPLLITYQLGFVASVFGVSLHVVEKVHQSLAAMVLVQGLLHSIIHLLSNWDEVSSTLVQIMVFAKCTFSRDV